MKNIFFILIIFCSLSNLMGQAGDGLQIITEGGNTGWRLFGFNPNNYGNIGSNAVDLSISLFSSPTRGATGSYSIATGYQSTAAGNYSIAMGRSTAAPGLSSMATGSFTTAEGNYSIAMGYETTAEGRYSIASGRKTTASGFATTAIGVYNTINDKADPTNFDLSNRALVIGNGTSGNLSDAMTVLFDGTTTIAGSVTAPSFIGDGSSLTNLPKAGLDKITEGPNAGWRLAGQNSNRYGAIGMNAVDLSISEIFSSVLGATGSSAVAMGYQNTASEFASTAMGRGTKASGVASTAMGTVTIASGGSSTAMGEATTASGSFSTAMGNSVIASGNSSTAMGRETAALGLSSMATGFFTTAEGNYSTAMGYNTTAEGSFSTAMGNSVIASGNSSTAIGRETTASGYGTTAIGIYNTINNNANATSFDYSNRAFVIGNGTDNANRSDALTVLFDGTTTIAGSMTATSFTGDGSALTNLPVAGLDQITEGSSTGWRLAGNSSDNYGDIGSEAVDLSVSNFASTTRGATGRRATAMGRNTTASGQSSTAIGYQTIASGDYSTAMGSKTEAQGAFSSASGIETMASGDFSVASGIQTIASGYGTMAIGSNNTTYSKAVPTTFDPVNRAFVIGNGQDGSNRSDAFTVYFDGTAILAGDLTVHSDRRLKTNISSLGSTLANLQLLDGKKYTMKNDVKQNKIGLLAQDVQKVYPELVKVSKDQSETLSLNYQGLIPVLINAVNEQQELIDAQDTKLEEQKVQIDDQQKQIIDYNATVEDLQKKTALQEAQICKFTTMMEQLISEK